MAETAPTPKRRDAFFESAPADAIARQIELLATSARGGQPVGHALKDFAERMIEHGK